MLVIIACSALNSTQTAKFCAVSEKISSPPGLVFSQILMNGSLGLIPYTQLDIPIYAMLLTSKYAIESYERVLANKPTHYINHKGMLHLFCIYLSIFLSTVMHIISVSDFPLFCSNSAQKCLILPAECSPQKSLILLEILPTEFIEA